MKVAVDTNVLVSAAIADGPPRRVLELAAEGELELVVPELVIEELRRILVDKLSLPCGSVTELIALVEGASGPWVPTPSQVEPLSGDRSDDEIIAAALSADAEILVSGDRKHVLPLGMVDGMRILRPQELLQELAAP